MAIVLIGSDTAGRKWIDYEIKKAWGESKGLLGVHIHKLKDNDSNQTTKGSNPFSGFNIAGKDLTSIVKTYDPPYAASNDVYNYIKDNLADWIETAVEIRNSYA